MRTFENWMQEYGQSHTHPKNVAIHKIFVPLIMLSVLGLFWCIPVPESWSEQSPYLNFASIFSLMCLIFYITLSKKYFVGMFFQCLFMLIILEKLDQTTSLLTLSISIFVVSWIFQFIGHKIEGKKPSFIQDLAFLLIGPLWVQKSIFKTLGLDS